VSTHGKGEEETRLPLPWDAVDLDERGARQCVRRFRGASLAQAVGIIHPRRTGRGVQLLLGRYRGAEAIIPIWTVGRIW
jgi:hypothetical protein